MSASGVSALEAELAARLGSSVKRVEQVLMAEKARVLRPHGLTVPQYATLLVLHHVTRRSAAQLARDVLVTPQTMATILGNLEDKGLVVRTPSVDHAKVLVTELTDAGRESVRTADRDVAAVERAVREAYSAEEFATLVTLLGRVEVALADRRDVEATRR